MSGCTMTDKKKPCLMDLRIEELKNDILKISYSHTRRVTFEKTKEIIDTWYARTKKELKGKEIGICKKSYPYVPSGDRENCNVCGHIGAFHSHGNGFSICSFCRKLEALPVKGVIE